MNISVIPEGSITEVGWIEEVFPHLGNIGPESLCVGYPSAEITLKAIPDSGTTFPDGLPHWAIQNMLPGGLPVSQPQDGANSITILFNGLGQYRVEAKTLSSAKTFMVNIVDLDLDIDADYDNTIATADESIEESAGGLVDLSTNPTRFEKIELDLDPTTLANGALVLSAVSGGNKIRIWNETKGTEMSLPWTWDVGTDVIPSTLYVEGIEASASHRDVELRLRYQQRANAM
ncbi:MAG: hypothetical protein GKR87_09250 [Kiritimatiellae bacterium]|nr:hypothetical protein [Kiritimatiellia bacterium]